MNHSYPYRESFDCTCLHTDRQSHTMRPVLIQCSTRLFLSNICKASVHGTVPSPLWQFAVSTSGPLKGCRQSSRHRYTFETHLKRHARVVWKHADACKYRATEATYKSRQHAAHLYRHCMTKTALDACSRSSSAPRKLPIYMKATLQKTEKPSRPIQTLQRSLSRPQTGARAHQQYPAPQHRRPAPALQPLPLHPRPPPRALSTLRLRGQHPANLHHQAPASVAAVCNMPAASQHPARLRHPAPASVAAVCNMPGAWSTSACDYCAPHLVH